MILARIHPLLPRHCLLKLFPVRPLGHLLRFLLPPRKKDRSQPRTLNVNPEIFRFLTHLRPEYEFAEIISIGDNVDGVERERRRKVADRFNKWGEWTGGASEGVLVDEL